MFALVPLIRAGTVPAATLMRGAVVEQGALRWRDRAAVAAAALLLAGFTIVTADDRWVALWFVCGALGAFIAFPPLAWLVMKAAAPARKPTPARPRLALAHLHPPPA